MPIFKKDTSNVTIYCYCPVCNLYLGKRKEDETTTFKDADCGYIWYFYPYKAIPKGIKIKPIKDSTCGCGGCGR